VYRIFWSTTDTGALELGAVTDPGVTEIAVGGLPAADTEFFFTLEAVDAAGNVGTNPERVGGMTGEDTTPPVFSGCRAVTEETAGGGIVAWAPAIDDTTPAAEMMYDVYAFEVPVTRDTIAGQTPLVTFTGGTSGEVRGLLPGTSYRLVCRARDAKDNADENLVVRMLQTKSDGIDPTFAGLTSATPGATMIDLEWPVATDDQTAAVDIVFHVYAALTPDGHDFDAPPIAKSPPGVTGMTLQQDQLAVAVPDGRVSNTEYFLVVRAVDEAGNESAPVAAIAARTLVSFALDVQPIFTENCALVGCHIPGNPPQGQILSEGYAWSNIVDQVALEGTVIGEDNLKRVDRTDPDPLASYLWRKISGEGTITGNSMPPPQAARVLTNEQKETIRSWIVQGALEN
jgi:hypothetical protein